MYASRLHVACVACIRYSVVMPSSCQLSVVAECIRVDWLMSKYAYITRVLCLLFPSLPPKSALVSLLSYIPSSSPTTPFPTNFSYKSLSPSSTSYVLILSSAAHLSSPATKHQPRLIKYWHLSRLNSSNIIRSILYSFDFHPHNSFSSFYNNVFKTRSVSG